MRTFAVQMTTSIAAQVETRIHELADPKRALGLQRFFRTGRGQYGEGDRFLGLYVPQVREVAREFATLPLKAVERLLDSPWHETRLIALILLTEQYRRGDRATKDRIYRFYLRRTDRINNWDLVDLSAPNIVGTHLLTRSRAPLRRLARSNNLWERRIAMVGTLTLIRKDDLKDALAIATLLLDDEEDLMHKAVGWMLREVGKRDEGTLTRFLDRHAGRMPRTALRYAIERLAPTKKKRYMSIPRRTSRR